MTIITEIPVGARCLRAFCGEPAAGTVTLHTWDPKTRRYDAGDVESPACVFHLENYGATR